MKKVSLEKQFLNKVSKKMFINLMIAIGIMIYFLFINLGYMNIDHKILLKDFQVFCIMFLFLGIAIIEKAYNKDDEKLALHGIESIALSAHTMTIVYVTQKYHLDFQYYLLTSSYIFAIYYVSKCIIIYTLAKKEYLKNMNDISEIVKKDVPSKKEAVKKNEKIEKQKINNEIDTKDENKNEEILKELEELKPVSKCEDDIKTKEPKKTDKVISIKKRGPRKVSKIKNERLPEIEIAEDVNKEKIEKEVKITATENKKEIKPKTVKTTTKKTTTSKTKKASKDAENKTRKVDTKSKTKEKKETAGATAKKTKTNTTTVAKKKTTSKTSTTKTKKVADSSKKQTKKKDEEIPKVIIEGPEEKTNVEEKPKRSRKKKVE